MLKNCKFSYLPNCCEFLSHYCTTFCNQQKK